ELMKEPLKSLVNTTQVTQRNDESDEVRFQDFLMHEVAYGRVQGFVTRKLKTKNITHLIRRLGYTREIYVIDDRKSWKPFVKFLFPKASIGKNSNVFFSKGKVAVRAITNQYFLENCEYILKVTPSLSRVKVLWFADRMFSNLMRYIYRIPASAKARVGKRFLDYLADRDEPSRYLSHGLHPYKGKFHPKMTRALINIVCSSDEGKFMDNFAGSGTLMVEASLMGFDSFGIEINPMSVLMANAKCSLLSVDKDALEKSVSKFLKILSSELELMKLESGGQTTLEEMKYVVEQQTLDEIQLIASHIYDDFEPNSVLKQILVARKIIESDFTGAIRDILQLGLAITISDLKGKKKKEFHNRIKFNMENIYRRSYLLDYLCNILPLKIGNGSSHLGDAGDFRDIREIQDLEGNVNSPPYSTALDYIKNDLNQLTLLGLIRTPEDLQELEQNMGGNPRAKYEKSEMNEKIDQNLAGLPDYAIGIIRLMNHFGRQDHAFRLYNFFTLLKNSLAEQFRVLNSGAKIATVIGNNHFKLTDSVDVISDDVINTDQYSYAVSTHSVVNNLRAIDPTPITGKSLIEQYGPDKPIKVSVTDEENNASRSGIFIEIENERIIQLLGTNIGFEPCIMINRYLEKTMRGNIRYESIVVLKKP
ncbi:MAG: hypothetical protein RTV31_17315, partial [Candidatus Thorarchaeota archaeon]